MSDRLNDARPDGQISVLDPRFRETLGTESRVLLLFDVARWSEGPAC